MAPELVIQRDFDKLFRFAELLFKVGKAATSNKELAGAASVYLLYPMAVSQQLMGGDEVLVDQLLDGLVALRAQSHGDVRQEAAIADMAESLIRARFEKNRDDTRLYGLLPEDVRGKYLRARAFESVC